MRIDIILKWSFSLFALYPLTCPAQAGKTTVVIFIIDGLQSHTASMAAANGADNLKFLINNGVWVEEVRCTSPAPRMKLPDGSLPWGTSTSPNVAMHTGTHVFESRNMDDIFLSAREAGIKSMFAGGAKSYGEFKTGDFNYASNNYSDSRVVDLGIQHLTEDNVRLVRLHLQRIRDHWRGPEEAMIVGSAYQKAILNADQQLGKLKQALINLGLWDSTFIIAGSDHGMGITRKSNHPPSDSSSWGTFMAFYGPGIKKNDTIPYAETPDIAIMAAHFLGIKKLAGHTHPEVTLMPKGVTGTFLSNIFIGQSRALNHPQLVRKFLISKNWRPKDDYIDYRSGILKLLRQQTKARPLKFESNLNGPPISIPLQTSQRLAWIKSPVPFNTCRIADLQGIERFSVSYPHSTFTARVDLVQNLQSGLFMVRLFRNKEMVGQRNLLIH